MATTCQDVVARAQAFSSSNGPLTADAGIMLSRIRADQSALFTKAAEVNRDFFATTATLTSTSGSANRTVDLTTLSPPIERLLRVTRTSDGVELNQVDPLDIAAELAPRYTTQGLGLVEVASDWGGSGTVGVTLLYVQGPTDISPTGSLTQAVSIPDRWTDILVVNLAQYLHHMDVGRDPAEGDRLQALADARVQDFVNYLTHVSGVEARRFVIPSPSRPEE
jgi:hypothetical protein